MCCWLDPRFQEEGDPKRNKIAINKNKKKNKKINKNKIKNNIKEGKNVKRRKSKRQTHRYSDIDEK